jgi:hypothetical protein
MQSMRFIIISGAVALGVALGAAETDSITTRDGTTYTNAVIQRADPDGIVIEYALRPGSLGIAKLKFANLPDELQKRYNYNPTDARIFEENHAAGIARRQEEIEQGEIEKKRRADALMQQRAEEEAAALEAKRQQDEANAAAAPMETGYYSYGDWYSPYGVGVRRHEPRRALRVPSTLPAGRVTPEPSPPTTRQLPATRSISPRSRGR